MDNTTTRVLTGTLPDGTPVLVTLFATGGELAFREDRRRWGVPTTLTEDVAS